VHVRPAVPDDAGSITTILAVVAEEGLIGTEPPVDVPDRTARLRALLEAPDAPVSFVLLDSDRIVGSATAYDGRPPGVPTLGMAILPEARGRGGGRMLLDAVLAGSRARGAHKLDLEVWPENGRAIALYVAAGSAVQGIKRDHYRRRDGSLKSALLMTRRLDDESSA
jgi:ribosomal protein S18 acetylase RimI-like enzyme